MEFFERAHVLKRNDSPRKDKKSEENMKKQLKQMLYGYKHNDNKAIKDSANRKTELEDAFSLSSYSELDVTTPSNDGDSKHDTDDDIASASDQEDVASSKASGSSQSSSKSDAELRNDQSNSNTVESISDVEDESQSFSSSLSSDLQKKISDENESISLDNSTTTTNMGSESSETFDADGALASKILRKLGKKEKLAPKIMKKKRKLNTEQEDNSFDIEEMKQLKIDEAVEDSEDSLSFSDEISSEGSSISEVRSPSPPYVLYEATGPLSRDLNDLLKDYKHSTVKNMPTDYTVKSSQRPLFTSDCGVINPESLAQEEYNNSYEDFEDELSFSNDEDDPGLDSSLQQTNNESMDIEDDQTFCDDQNESGQIVQSPDKETSDHSSIDLDTSLTNSIKVYYCKKSCIFVMRHPAELYIHGKVKVSPLGGTAEVFGHIVKDPCEIYAPHTNFAQCLRTVQNENSYYGLFSKLTAAGMSVADTEDVVTSLGEHDVVVQLQPITSNKLNFVEHNFNVTDLFNKQSKNIENCMKQASELLGCSFYLKKPMRYFEEFSGWTQALKYGMNKQSRGIVCGGKGTGKSTFLRFYVNKLLAAGPVLVIDLDPGQCEFTVAGNVSATVVTGPLLGPNFTHLRTPDRMLNIGMINVMENLRRYANAVASLINHCNTNKQYQNMPWIVNTMGMCNTVGQKLVALITLLLKPTFLLQLDSKNVKRRFDCFLNAHRIKQNFFNVYQKDCLFKGVKCSEHFDYAFCVSNQITDGTGKGNNFSLSPRDERYLNYLSYFGELLDIHNGMGFLNITPYEVPLEFFNIATNVKIDAEATVKVINGKIIALCQQSAQDKARKIFALDDKPLVCHGYGLIRGIDNAVGLMYIVTPVSADRLSLVDTLVYGDWVPELRGQERHLPGGTPVPYRTDTLHQQRQLMFAPRRRFNPLQFLKMSRSS